MYFNIAIRQGNNKIIGTLPQGFRPASALIQNCIGFGLTNTGYIFIGADGEVRIEGYTEIAAGTTYMASFTFVASN